MDIFCLLLIFLLVANQDECSVTKTNINDESSLMPYENRAMLDE